MTITVEREEKAGSRTFAPGKLVESEVTGHIYLVIDDISRDYFEGVRLYSVTNTAKVPDHSNTFNKDNMKPFYGKIIIETKEG